MSLRLLATSRNARTRASETEKGGRSVLVAFALVASAALACGPGTVEEAEARGDVKWLVEHSSAASVAALGRLADGSPAALAALQQRAEEGSTSTFVAAWDATKRDRAWGAELLKRALSDPRTSEKAALALTRADAHLGPLVPAIEQAVIVTKDGSRGLAAASLLVSAGAPAKDALEARLRDGATRAIVCQALGAKEAPRAAKQALLDAPPTSRDHASCMNVVVRLAAEDDAVLTWLAEQAEPGLLREASESSYIPCEKVRPLWAKVFATRRPEEYSSLGVPLAAILKRCPSEMDFEVSRALRTKPLARPFVLSAIDPLGALVGPMSLTCVELTMLAKSREPPLVRDKASELAGHGCYRSR